MSARILILDDEPGVLNALRRALRREGWLLTFCSDPQEALRKVEAEEFDLVISDYRMPGMDGVTFLTRVLDHQPDCMRIILSGQADMDGVLAAINEARIYRFITKPWNDAELIITIRQALHLREVELENRRLADLVRDQQAQIDYQRAELERLERESPGITRVDFDESGAIVINEEDYR